MLAELVYCDEPEHLAPTTADEINPKECEDMVLAIEASEKRKCVKDLWWEFRRTQNV